MLTFIVTLGSDTLDHSHHFESIDLLMFIEFLILKTSILFHFEDFNLKFKV